MIQFQLGTVVAALLSAGGGAFLVALVKGWSDMRSGARAGQREVVADLMSWRDDLEEKHRLACADRDYWRDVAAQRGHQIRNLGATPEATDAEPPSDRRPARNRRRNPP